MPKYEAPAPPYVGPAKWHGADNNKPIARIVIHCTVGQEPGVKGAARATVARSKRTSRPSSYHYCVDSAEAVQYVYDSVVAYHAPPNQHSLGVELCCSLTNEGRDHWQRADHQAMLKRAAELVAGLALAYDVPITKLSPADLKAGRHGICGHVDVRDAWHETSHWDPGPHFPWGQFLGMVRAAADKLRRTPPAPPKPPKPQPKPQPEPGTKTLPVLLGHQSGKGPAPYASWRKGIAQLVDYGATVVSLTETYRDGLLPRIVPDGWDHARLDDVPGQSECSLLWTPKVWEPASKPYAVCLSEKVYHRHDGPAAPLVHGLVQPLRHRKLGTVVLFGAVHLPSNIQGGPADVIAGPRKGMDPREAVTEDAVANMGKLWQLGRRRHPGAARSLSGDFNLDYRKPFVRDWWSKTFPVLANCWEPRHPAAGTHGKRVIDWYALSPQFRVVGAHVKDKVPDLDHRGLIVRARLEEAKS